MKKSMRKIGIAVALAMTITSVFAGCGKTKDDTASKNLDTSKAVTLKMYILGDKPKDFNLVYGKINNEMKKKINATLDVKFISFGDMDTKYPLLFSSGEDFDLAFTGTWCYYNQMATRNGFLELTQDMLKKYAPNTFKNEPKIAWDQAKVNGKIYMVPNDQNEYSYNVIGVRGDLCEKYGIGKIKSEDDLEKYYQAIAKNEKNIVPMVNGGGQNLEYPYLVDGNGFATVTGTPKIGPLVVYKINNSSDKPFSIVDTPEYKSYVTKMKEFADKGYWSKDSISSKETRDDAFKAGKAASMVWNVGTVASDVATINKNHPDWKAEVVDINPGVKKMISPYTNNGMGINANSKNPERALMALDLLRYDRNIQDLSFWGIKGTHWEAVGDNKYKTLAANANFPAGNVCPWGWHTSITRVDANQPEIVNQLTDLWKKQDVVNNPLEGFSFDDSKVKNEIAAINNVITQYGVPLDLGIESDVDKGIDVYKQKLKEAGLDKLMQEVKTQTAAYLKEHK